MKKRKGITLLLLLCWLLFPLLLLPPHAMAQGTDGGSTLADGDDDAEVEEDAEFDSSFAYPGYSMSKEAHDVDRDLSRTLKSEKVSEVNQINLFLTRCRGLLSDKTSLKHIVLGNRAADLDSIVSALAYAYLQFTLDPSQIYLPVINIKRERFRLRTEAKFLFKRRRIFADLFIFRDEFDFDWHHSNNLLRLILVDHNSLDRIDAHMDDSVVAVFDHHNDEGKYLNAETRVIEPVGSCTTLIAREIFKHCPHFLDRNLARILLAPIVIDTSNFDPRLARPMMSLDEEVASALLDVIEPHKYPKLQYRSRYFLKLLDAKNNVTDLASNDLLRRDYKEWDSNGIRYGISTVPYSFKKWLERDSELSEHFLDRMRAKHLDLLIIMLLSFESSLSRELIIFTDHQAIGDALTHFLMLSDDLDLVLFKGPETQVPPMCKDQTFHEIEPKLHGACNMSDISRSDMEIPEHTSFPSDESKEKKGFTLYAFNQKNASLSRKFIQPLVHNILAKISLNQVSP